MTPFPNAASLTRAIYQGETTARSVIEDTLAQVEARDGTLNCFTAVTTEAALQQATRVDDAIASGKDPGPLAGVPFAVKNLYDVEGIVTLAGSKINRENSPATQDATLVARMKAAGAILVGSLNMDEYAYGFVTINSHDGATPNPHDLSRMSGGSSGGSAAAVAAGLVPITLGSDTNGSIRVPAALCGIYGLKPTYGRLSRKGSFLFVSSLDHLGPFARSVRDLAVAFDVMQGPDPADPVCTDRPADLVMQALSEGIQGLRIAVAGDHFALGMQSEVAAGLEKVAKALQVNDTVTLPEAARARAAAFILTACEGSQLHIDRLRTRPMDFDVATRDRFLAGALVPSGWYIQAQRFRRWYRDRMRDLFQSVDVILAPTVPCVAPPLDQTTLEIEGKLVPLRPNLGLYTQPLSFIGLPIVSVPVHQPGKLPVGIQVIGAPYQEAKVLRVAAYLEKQGITTAPIAQP
ncbi:AtzE family amidohydrolase [Pseudanabaena sp. FACHB-2040]|uniref:AtzE family amidohydrolase n=1 Tax=Pseudanabaena sp. FACHB-2040 TaxID=2692859 RepID=UPI00168309D8|nr:AtzE family amidohydrolase [Pseudanabaena sp. FACHB-2040]